MLFISSICPFFYRQYLDNIGLVDIGVAELVSIIEDFFGYDGRTAYVFTSDHGMTNWGETRLLTYAFLLYAAKKIKNKNLFLNI